MCSESLRSLFVKVLSFLKWTISTLAILFLLAIIYCLFCVYAYADFDRDVQSTYLSNCTHITSNIYTNTTPNQDAAPKIESFYELLSPNVRSVLSQDWKIIITHEVPNCTTQEPNDSHIVASTTLGCSSWDLRLIYIKSIPISDEIYEVFIHELGHCFDYEFGFPSFTDEFIGIYEQYKDIFFEISDLASSNYTTSTVREFFATVFMNYFLYPDHLRATAPAAYSFFDSLYNEISTNPTAQTTLKYDLQSALLILRNRFLSQ